MRLPIFVSLLVVGLMGCNQPRLDTRTFELKYINADEAIVLIDPYVYGDREGSPGSASHTQNALTVRETPDNLERIQRVLERFDKPSPRVQLRFQIIEADGFRATDPAIADVESELRQLFRFTGYRLAGEAMLVGAPYTRMVQTVGEEGSFVIDVNIGAVRLVGDTGIVEMEVELRTGVMGMALATTINARVGTTLVLGNAKLSGESATMILTVRPELVN